MKEMGGALAALAVACALVTGDAQACEHEASFVAQLDSAQKDNLYENACQITSAYLLSDPEACESLQAACAEQEEGQVQIFDPWDPSRSSELTCESLTALACSGLSDASALVAECKRALHVSDEDPLFVTPISTACGAWVGLASFGAAWSTSTKFPNVPSSTTQLWSLLPGIVGLFGCAMIPF